MTLAVVVNKMNEMGMARLMTRGLNYKVALELLGFKVQKSATGKFTVTGKRLRTAASQNVADDDAPNPDQPIRPRRRAFLEAQRFSARHAADLDFD